MAVSAHDLPAAELLKHPKNTYFAATVLDREVVPGPGLQRQALRLPGELARLSSLAHVLEGLLKTRRDALFCRVAVTWNDVAYHSVRYEAFGKTKTCFAFDDGEVYGDFLWLSLSSGARRLAAWIARTFTGNDHIALGTITLCAKMA